MDAALDRLPTQTRPVLRGVAEQLVGLLDPVEREAMRDHRRKIDPARGHDLHQAAHAFLAAGAQRRDDRVISKAGGESVERDA